MRNSVRIPLPCLHLFTGLLSLSALLLGAPSGVAQVQNYFGGTGALNGSTWSTAPGGPFTSAFSTDANGGVANFNVAGTMTGGSLTVAGINAIASVTLSTPSGTIGNFGNGVITMNIGSGALLDFSTEGFTTSLTAGYIKTGSGAVALAGGTYGGGFTLNDGTVIARGINAMGGNATPGGLTINGGAIGANAARDFSGKYSGITVGGDFQLGVSASAISIASDTANLTFNANTSLGAATRTITVGANGVYTLGGIISGDPSVGLIINKLPTATGTVALNGLNTYSGKTTVNGATLAINSDSSLGAVPGVATADSLTLNGGTLAPSANVTLSANRGITLGVNGGTIRGASGSALNTFNNSITGAGGLTLSLGAVDFKTANTFAGGLLLSAPTGGAIVARFDANDSAGTGTITVTPIAGGSGALTLRNVGAISTTITNNIVLNANNGHVIALGADTGGTFTLSGQISGTGTATHGQQGVGGEVVLSGDNSGWSGGLIATRGITTLGHKNALGTGALTISPDTTAGFDAVAFKAAIDLSGANAIANPVTISVAPTAAIPNVTFSGNQNIEFSGPITLAQTTPTIINNNSGATIFSGNIGDGGNNLGMTLQGSGKLTLKGNNTYTGPTVVNGTTLIVNNTAGSGTGSGTVTVNTGGVLKGSGTIGGPVILNGGSKIAAGNSPGHLTTGSETWNGLASLEFELSDAMGVAGVDNDLVSMVGDLTLNATSGNQFTISLVSLALGNVPGNAANFDKNQSYSWKFAEISGNLNGFDAAAFNIDTSLFSNDTTGATPLSWFVSETPNGGGHDLYLNFTAVPEPSTIAFAALGGIAFAGAAWRRRRKA